MPPIQLTLACPMHDSFRVRQIAGMFDLPWESVLRETIHAELPRDCEPGCEPWTIGVIAGPSGGGKTTLARRAFGDALHQPAPWPEGRAVIDCLGDHPIKRLVQTLTAVGFSTPRAWIKPHAILSTGEKFRAELARAVLTATEWGTGRVGEGGKHGCGTAALGCDLPKADVFLPCGTAAPGCDLPKADVVFRSNTAEGGCATCPSPPLPSVIVFDEFTSPLGRTAAKVCSYALSRAIRRGQVPVRLVAITCHEDIIDWLEPDWVLRMPAGLLQRGRLRRPPVHLRIRRANRSMWDTFKRHHYLTHDLHPSARCFVALVEGHPAAFAAALPFPHPLRPGWREHRLVCLPDYQGIGIGTTISDYVAGLFAATGKPYFSTTSHPAMIRHRAKSSLWKMLRKPGMVSRSGRSSIGTTRMADTNSRGRITASFEFVGGARMEDVRLFGLM